MSTSNQDTEFSIMEKLSKTEKYIEENKKSLGIILVAVLVLVLGYLAYIKFIVGPAEDKARGQMFTAERYFEQDSLKKAIDGDGNFPGFKQIIEEYGSTKSGNLARYYLGMSYLKTGKFQEAIDNLNAYDGEDEMTAVLAIGAVGDAYLEMGKTEEAIKQYQKAANENKNNFTSPIYLMKSGRAFELLGKYADALQAYEQVKKEYPSTTEGTESAKYIARAKALIK